MKRRMVEFSMFNAMISMLGFNCIWAQAAGTKAAQTSTEAWL
jgi:hypothetical protein